jgi:phosphoribosylformylglycinamidine synthase subunit PurL
VYKLISNKLIKSAHDISEGGLFACLLECSMTNNFGFTIDTDPSIRKDAVLFGESQSRVVITVNPDIHALVEAELKDVPFTKIGYVNANNEINIDGESWGFVNDWKEAYDSALEKLLIAPNV